MDRSECVHGILHEVLWECEASSHRFSINGLLSQKRREDACALQKSRDCGTKHNAQEFAQARHGEFVLWRTAKLFIDSSTDITNPASVIPSEVEESLDIFPILLPGQSRTITAAPRLFFRGLRSPTPAIQRTRAFRGVRPRCSLLSGPCGYARHSRLASHHELLLRSPSNL
jgi:hypothetical protein